MEDVAPDVEKREKKEDSELDKIMSKVEVLRISQVSSDDVELGALRVSISFVCHDVVPLNVPILLCNCLSPVSASPIFLF